MLQKLDLHLLEDRPKAHRLNIFYLAVNNLIAFLYLIIFYLLIGVFCFFVFFAYIFYIFARDGVVSQRLKFGSVFLSYTWESKITLLF